MARRGGSRVAAAGPRGERRRERWRRRRRLRAGCWGAAWGPGGCAPRRGRPPGSCRGGATRSCPWTTRSTGSARSRSRSGPDPSRRGPAGLARVGGDGPAGGGRRREAAGRGSGWVRTRRPHSEPPGARPERGTRRERSGCVTGPGFPPSALPSPLPARSRSGRPPARSGPAARCAPEPSLSDGPWGGRSKDGACLPVCPAPGASSSRSPAEGWGSRKDRERKGLLGAVLERPVPVPKRHLHTAADPNDGHAGRSRRHWTAPGVLAWRKPGRAGLDPWHPTGSDPGPWSPLAGTPETKEHRESP